MEWFRSIHGAPTHRKWLSVARKAGMPVPVVVATVWALLDHASRADDRGSIAGFDLDDQAAFLGVDEDDVAAVIDALREKGWVAGARIASWCEHQSKREDGAAERAKAWRERKKAQERGTERTRTQPNARERPDTDTEIDISPNGDIPPTPQGSEPDGFADFWQAYPRKVGKPRAIKAYRSALARASPGKLIAGARRLAAERQGEDEKFTPHPTTWINRDGWDDPPAPKTEARRNGASTSHRDNFVSAWMGGEPAPGSAAGYGDPPRRQQDHAGSADAAGRCLEGRFERVG